MNNPYQPPKDDRDKQPLPAWVEVLIMLSFFGLGVLSGVAFLIAIARGDDFAALVSAVCGFAGWGVFIIAVKVFLKKEE